MVEISVNPYFKTKNGALYRADAWKLLRVLPKKSERTPHPTQKPIGLIEHLVKGWSDVGDVVLDPFAGSGTTLVVAEKLRRRWIGIEINPEYAEIAKSRVLGVLEEKEVGLGRWLKWKKRSVVGGDIPNFCEPDRGSAGVSAFPSARKV